MTRLFYAWFYQGLCPYEFYNMDKRRRGYVLPPHPYPGRLRYLLLAFAGEAHEYNMRLHNVHPEQHGQGKKQPKGVDLWLPGGMRGRKLLPQTPGED